MNKSIELEKYKLNDIALGFSYGSMPKEEDLREEGYPVFSGYRIVGYSSKYNIRKRSIVVVARGVGGTGNVEIAEEKTFLTNLSIAVEIDENKADIDYLYYYLNLQGLRYLDTGAAQSQITINNLKQHKIFVPVLNLQKSIVGVIKQYDLAIENNNKRIKILEQMAENLYKEWFVRFRFPGHENVEFEIGIPKGWEYTKLGDIADFAYGKMPNQEHILEDSNGYPIFSGYRVNGYYDSYMYEDEKLVLIARGVGGTGDVAISPPKSYITNLSIVFNLKNEALWRDYLYQRFRIQNLRYLDTGAAQSQITIENLKRVKVIMPSEKTLCHYNEIINTISCEMRTIERKNDILIKQRDLLLPRLMSGKLQVK